MLQLRCLNYPILSLMVSHSSLMYTGSKRSRLPHGDRKASEFSQRRPRQLRTSVCLAFGVFLREVDALRRDRVAITSDKRTTTPRTCPGQARR